MPPTKQLSEPLKQLLSLWMSGKGIAPAVRKQALGKGYPVFSWYSIMAGMGIFPDPVTLACAARHAGSIPDRGNR